MKIQTYFKEIQHRIFFWFFSLLINTILFIFYREEIFYLLGQQQPKLFPYFIATNIPEVFVATIKLIIFLSVYTSLPIIIFQLGLFLIPALYAFEYNLIKKLILITFVLFLGTSYIAVAIIIPLCWNFFLSFELVQEHSGISIHLETRLNEYLNFFIHLFFLLNVGSYLALSFFLILQKLTLNSLIKIRKLVYFIFFLLATIITPPDLGSQIIVGLLFIIFYEIMLFCFFLIQEYNKLKPGE